MSDQPVGKHDPMAFGDQSGEIAFDRLGRSVFGQSQPLREPRDMRVHDYARGDAESVAEYHVCSFSSDTAEGKQIVHSLRDAAAVFVDDSAARGLDVFGFIAEKARGMDVSFELFLGNAEVIGGAAVFAEKVGGYDVYTLVRALRRQNCRDQKLERGSVIQGAMGVRIVAAKAADDLGRVGLQGVGHCGLG